MMIPNRNEYLKQQARQGQKIMGVLPAQYPKELLWAFDILPAEIWDPPREILQANAHLQTTICPVVKRGLEFILKESDIVSVGYLFPHTCDSLQNLATQVRDLIQIPVPVYTFYNPKGRFSRATQDFYRDILIDFQALLADGHGPLKTGRLQEACELGYRIDTRLMELQHARMTQRTSLNNQEYFSLMRAGEYLHPRDYLKLLDQVKLTTQTSNPGGPRLLISGILPPNNEILTFLDALGVQIVADDLLSVSRRIPVTSLDPPQDPLEYLTDRFFLQSPCSTRASSLDERLHHLQRLIAESSSQGVIFNIVKFCEPELFDHRFLARSFKDNGLPQLSLETELDSGLTGQTKTRIEAFVELLNDEVLA